MTSRHLHFPNSTPTHNFQPGAASPVITAADGLARGSDCPKMGRGGSPLGNVYAASSWRNPHHRHHPPPDPPILPWGEWWGMPCTPSQGEMSSTVCTLHASLYYCHFIACAPSICGAITVALLHVHLRHRSQ